jgi:acetyl/propionyl-CoA carboxylase alpha subunit
MLRLPSGTGVRVDSGVREGDEVSADFDSMIAKVIAWGRDRAEASARLRRALAQSLVVVEGGTTNRSFLIGLLDRPEYRSGAIDNRWLDRYTSGGEHLATPRAVALLAAAVEAYNADNAAVVAAFHAGARRGRPEMPDRVGVKVRLRYAGVGYELEVHRTSPGSYRVVHGHDLADLQVEFLNPYERRIRCGDRDHRVTAVATREGLFRIGVDDTEHRVTRDDGGVVRAGWPAFVVSLLVQPGDVVAEGDPVAVLESMKMESTITAPFPGEVAAVDVVPNTQVGTRPPLWPTSRAWWTWRASRRVPRRGPPSASGCSERWAATCSATTSTRARGGAWRSSNAASGRSARLPTRACSPARTACWTSSPTSGRCTGHASRPSPRTP